MDLRQQLRDLVMEAVAALAGDLTIPPVAIDVPKAQGHGDYSTNIALLMSKALRRKPVDVAADLAARIPVGPLVARIEVAGPGFLNFFLADGSVASALRHILEQGDSYGRSDAMAGKSAIVEFVSANPTGPLHIGHARNAALGDCICRALERVGCRVYREYYFNDAGVQMKRLGGSVKAAYLVRFRPDTLRPEDGYGGEYIEEIAAELHAKVGEGWADRHIDDFARYAETRIVAMIDADLEALSIRFDRKFSETSLHASGAVDTVLDRLKAAGRAYEDDGALWLRTTDDGDEKDRVLVKRDGEKTYLSPDIAYHEDKFARGFDLLINLLGADHHSYAIRLKAAARALGHDPERLRCIIYQLVTVMKDGQAVKFGKRLGNAISLREMIDEIGPDAIRFFFAMRKSDSHMEFDWDLAKKQSPDNPVYYVQYAHARCCAILRKAAEDGLAPAGAGDGDVPAAAFVEADFSTLNAPAELELMLCLYDFPRFAEAAGVNTDPQRYTTILRDVAERWNGYQTAGKIDRALRILRPEDPDVTRGRLALVTATRQVLRNGLDALGCSAPRRMDRPPVEAEADAGAEAEA